MRRTWWTRRSATLLTMAVVSFAACGCGGGDDADSPILNEEVPVADIADLPDVDETRSQMLGLVEQVRAEVSRLVPATEPWSWNREESRSGCTQEGTGRKGVALYFANLVSEHAFTDQEWDVVFPVVQRIAGAAGLPDDEAMQDSAGNHDVRFSSDDGRTLIFGSETTSVISATITCRRPAGGTP